MSPGPKIIQDAYEYLEDLGKGGMAHVYKARQVSLDRFVAIKEIKPAFSASPELVLRFKREARTAAGLVHENIVQIYNFGEPDPNSLFIVMEYVDGFDLKTLLKRAGMVPPRPAAIIIRQVARALVYAHARGLVHRDVKPANVMVARRGEVKLMDFGIVREVDSDLTKTGAFLGTPNYMAPEQFLGEKATPATDLFSLGVVAYELLTGEKPFKADDETSLSKKVRTQKEAKPRSKNPEVPRRLQAIVIHCLQKKAEKRPADAEALLNNLDKFLGKTSREEQRRELSTYIREIMSDDDVLGLEADGIPIREERPSSRVSAGPNRFDADSRRPARPPSASAGPAPRERVPERPPSKPPQAIRLEMGPRVDDEEISIAPEKARPRPEKTRERPETRSEQTPSSARKKPPAPKPRPEPDPRDQDRDDGIDPAQFAIKWLWRLILLAILVLVAIIVFNLFKLDYFSQILPSSSAPPAPTGLTSSPPTPPDPSPPAP